MTSTNPPATLPRSLEAEARDPETRSRAIDMAIAALGQRDESELVLELVSEGLEQDNRLEDATALAHRSTVLHATSGAAWTRFSRLSLKLARGDDAVEAARKAIDLLPDDFMARTQAAAAFMAVNDFPEAIAHADRAAELNPFSAEALSTLAILHTRIRAWDEARSYAERALLLKPGLPGGQIALARADLAQGEAGAAVVRLRRLLAFAEMSDIFRAEALSVLGDSLDAVDAPGGAYAAYAACNAVLSRQPDFAKAESGRRVIDHAAGIARRLQAMDAQLWRSSPAADETLGRAATHVFLLGFPRSGTTLLENALASHPAVIALEETNALAEGVGDLLTDGAALERLARITPEQAKDHRARYWRRVEELAGSEVTGKVVVDKFPTATVALPAIFKLFPNAKILFARRDPRDVVWSCFRRLFGVNVVMAGFMKLENAAEYYDRVMSIAEISLDRMPLDVCVVKHEEVVADFDAQLAEILKFVGLDWHADVRDFAERGLRARTPSATQLAAGLNDQGVGAWRRFQTYMSDILPVLEPWVAKFGYAKTGIGDRQGSNPGFDAYGARISQAVGAGDWRTAYSLVEQASAEGYAEPLMFRVRGVRRQNEGKLDEAVADFTRALESAPGDVNLLSALGLCLARQGKVESGLARLEEALALDPNFAAAHFNRGFALEQIGDIAAARESYLRAINLNPHDARPLGALAFLASRSADWAEASDVARRALAMAPGLPSATLALSAALAADGDLDQAERHLEGLVRSPVGQHELAMAHFQLGDLRDRQHRPREAFASYERGGATLLALHRPRFEQSGRERASDLVERLNVWLKTANPGTEVEGSTTGPRPPAAFVMGFPRSGTTLVAQALGAHPGCFTLDERPVLRDSADAFYGAPDGLTRFNALSEEDVRHFRDLYFRRAREEGWPGPAALLVDKMPTGAQALPLISRFIPDAKIIFMLRDPRDVVFGCFRRPFAINSTTIDLQTIEGAARLYDQSMSFFFEFTNKFELNVRMTKHEDLVGAISSEMLSILEFLELEWDPGVLDFAARANETATPSRAQLAAGLNPEGVGAWRPYAFALDKVQPILAPWIERFGYDKD